MIAINWNDINNITKNIDTSYFTTKADINLLLGRIFKKSASLFTSQKLYLPVNGILPDQKLLLM